MNTRIKFFVFCFVVLWNCPSLLAQATLKLGANPLTKNKNAAFEIESTSQGLLLPRVTLVQMNAISANHTGTNPIPSGLVVFCTDCNANGQMYVFNANATPPAWSGLGSSLINVPILANLSNFYTYTSNTAFSLKATVDNNGQNSTSIDAATLPSIGFVYKDYNGPTTSIPTKDTDNIALVATRTGLSIGSPYSTSFTGMSNAKSYFFIPFAISGGGPGYGTPFVYSIAPPTFASIATTDLTSTQVSKVSVAMTLLAGVPFNAAKFSYGTTAAATDNTNLVLAETPSIENSTNESTVTLKASIPVMNTQKIYVKFTATTNGTVATSSSADYSFTPTVEISSGGSATVTTIVPGTAPAAINVGVLVPANTYWNFAINSSIAGTFYIEFVSNGLTFKGSGNLLIGQNTVPIAITGTPTRYGTMSISTNLYSNVTPSVTSSIVIGFTSQPAGGTAICDATHGTTINEITSSTQKIWMDRNLGAYRAATSITDYFGYGCLFQWGRGNDGHANVSYANATTLSLTAPLTSSLTNTTLSVESSPSNLFYALSGTFDWLTTPNSNLWQGVTGVNNPCPLNYRLPTNSEISNEFANLRIGNYTQAAAFGSATSLVGYKFLLQGIRNSFNGSIGSIGSMGYYWTSDATTTSSSVRTINVLATTYLDTGTTYAVRSSGYAVRCIKD